MDCGHQINPQSGEWEVSITYIVSFAENECMLHIRMEVLRKSEFAHVCPSRSARVS